ncbi:myosin-G heavy chain [Drosophila albomicans]|uniref:Myosin-G heavy chain n=1 Tax=Drosophila albomicans TaxID=7291 RepID=A0A6P8XBR5_DROAB|nr:myosin-G heavy chain [Drosophila albomicans]
MSCISSNFSSFFLNSVNDPSEFSKYLSNGELKCTNFEEFQVFAAQSTQQQQQHQQQQHLPQQQQQQQQQQYLHINGAEFGYEAAAATSQSPSPSTALPASQPLLSNRWPTAVATPNGHHNSAAAAAAAAATAQHFDGSFEFIKYLRHSTDFTPNSSSNNNNIASSSSGSAADGDSAAASVEKCSKLAASAGRVATPPLTLPASPVGASGGSGVGLLDLDSTSIAQKSRSASRKVAAMLSSVSRSSNSLDANSSTLDAVFDHDSKQTMFELQHMTSASNGSNGSNSNESSLELLAFPSSHLNASNSNTSSEEHCGSAGEFGGLLSGASCSSASAAAPKLLGSFVIKENFEVHPSHKVEEGIFQHMNKLPSKKKDTLKQLGVRFTGQMTLTDKSIVVENFIKFCEEYDIKDHRPWLSLNQCGLNKPEQIKFARYLGQGLPTFTLFCIYSNFKNLFCTKRTEIYTKDGYNLPYILDKTKRFLANTTADLKNMAAANDGTLEFASNSSSSSNSNNNMNNNSSINNNSSSSVNSNSSSTTNSSTISLSNTVNSYVTGASNAAQALDSRYSGGCMAASLLPPPPSMPPLGPPPRSLEQLIIYENFNVHETHRIEDGVCTHISRLPPKKQELLKQFGIQSSSQQCLSNYEKCILIENFIKFCNEYQISDHRPFLDFHESALSKCEQLKFVRYLGQGLSNLTLNKIYVAFKDLLGNGRAEKAGTESYNLDVILKKKRKHLYNRLHATATSVDMTSYDAAQSPQLQHQQQQQQQPIPLPTAAAAAPRPHHAFAALTTTSTPHSSEVSNDLTQYSYVQQQR